MQYGTGWTRWGQYNWAIYEAGERIEALPWSPMAHTQYAVLWYPGKLTVGFCLGSASHPLEIIDRLDSPLKAVRVLMQEPVEGGAWWLITDSSDQPVGPYTWSQVTEWQ